MSQLDTVYTKTYVEFIESLYVDISATEELPDSSEATEMENKIKTLVKEVGQLEFQLMW